MCIACELLSYKDVVSDKTACIFSKMATIDTKGIFYPCSGSELDLLFFSTYKTRTVSDLVYDMVEENDNHKLNETNITMLANIMYNMFSNTWEKLKKAISTDISVTGQSQVTETETLNTTGSNDYSKETTGNNAVYGFDSDEAVNANDNTSTESTTSNNSADRERTLTKITVNGNQNNIEVVKRMLGVYQYDMYKNIFSDVSRIMFTANYD